MRQCPVDDFTLKPELYEGVPIDRCPHCRGVWLDHGELEAIQSTQDSDFRDVPLSVMDKVTAASAMAKAKTEKALTCVTCDTALVKREYSFSSQIMIDNCPKGHGMWLDASELELLQAFYEDEQDFANHAEAEILKELREGGITGFFAGLLKAIKR